MAGGRRPNEISAGGVVVRPDGAGWEVCLIRVGRFWGIPKGNLEPGEQPADAALREISEETGLPRDQLVLRGPLPRSEYVYRREGRLIFKLVHHFLVEAPAGASLHRQESEVDEAQWVTLDEAERRVTFKDLHAALLEVRTTLADSRG